jgi:trehalose 2-sulfotransferase
MDLEVSTRPHRRARIVLPADPFLKPRHGDLVLLEVAMAATDTDSYDRLFFEFDGRTEPRVSYLVCSIPRSGSSLLCELLSNTGLAGAPAEFFHPDKMAALKQRWGVETQHGYVRELLARKTSPNGVFGLKAHWGQYKPAFGEANPRVTFPRAQLLFITRSDRLRQAISWVRALQTLKWATQDNPRPRPEVFDADHITQQLVRIDREEEVWESMFDHWDIEPRRIVYEDFVAAQEEAVRDVLGFLGVDAPAELDLPAPVLGRQADALSDEWAERYLAEVAG